FVKRSALFASRSHLMPESAHLFETYGAAIRVRHFPFCAALRRIALYRQLGKRGGSADTLLADRQDESPLCTPIGATAGLDGANLTITRAAACRARNRSAAEAIIAGDASGTHRHGNCFNIGVRRRGRRAPDTALWRAAPETSGAIWPALGRN